LNTGEFISLTAFFRAR